MEDEELPQEYGTVLTADDVQRRVADWLDRLRKLYVQISPWAMEHGWQVSELGTVPMHEELMQKFDVAQAQQPTLRLDKSDGKYVFFKPKALWVIGANGRVDLYTQKGTFIVVDLAGRFEDPIWTVYGISERRKGVPFTADLLSEIA